MNKYLEMALRYAQENEWFVFPCREIPSEPFWDESLGEERIMKTKSPYTSNGFRDASRDPAQIKEWWTRHPNSAIGVSCGHSGLVVVDIDIKKDRNGYTNFMSIGASDEGALHSLTPSGGSHIVYSGKANSHADIIRGIDLRAEAAYFIAPPSEIWDDDKNIFVPYIALDDWTRKPASVPEGLLEKLDFMRRGEFVRKPRSNIVYNKEESIKRAKIALEKLPDIFCEDYFSWVNVGLSLKELGDEGFELWNNWSMKSSKYDYKACLYRWNKFNPREISLGSLFYWASQSNGGKE